MRRFGRFMRVIFFFLLDKICVSLPTIATPKSQKAIVLVRLDAIGDFVLWQDAAFWIRKVYPPDEYHITLVANKAWASLAKAQPHFDAICEVDMSKIFTNPFYRFNLLRRIGKAGFDIAIHPTYSREFLSGDSIIRATKAPKRIGSQGDLSNIRPWQKRLSDRWYTDIIPAREGTLMELERNAEFVRGLGLDGFQASVPRLEIKHEFPESVALEKKYYVLVPGASTAIKQWPLERFQEMAVDIYRQTGYVGYICGGNNEIAHGQWLMQHTSVPIENWVGRTTLEELAILISKSQFVVGNDTAAIHMATALGVPSVCIVGGGHFGRFIPYPMQMVQKYPLPVAVFRHMSCCRCNWHCIFGVPKKGPVACIGAVTVQDVLRAIEKVLSRAAPKVLKAQLTPLGTGWEQDVQASNLKPTMAFVDHSFHKKTKSVDFLREILKEHFEVTNFWDEQLGGGGSIPPETLNQYQYVFFFQCINAYRELAKIKSTIIWAPMYDGLPLGDLFWKKIASLDIRILCFSKAVQAIAEKHGLMNQYVQYFKPPVKNNQYHSANGKKALNVFFWFRGTIKFCDWKSLFDPSDLERIVYLSKPDPGFEEELLSNEEIAEYKIDVVPSPFLRTNEEYLKYVEQCDIFVAPRRQEGIGMSTLEAMAMGKCVIAYNDATMNEYIQHGVNGFLFNGNEQQPVPLGALEQVLANNLRFAWEGYRKWEMEKKEIVPFCMDGSPDPSARPYLVRFYNLLDLVASVVRVWPKIGK